MTQIHEGRLHIFAAFDIGFEIKTQKILQIFPNAPRMTGQFPFLSNDLGRENAPVVLTLPGLTVNLGGRAQKFEVYAAFFDIGALSLEIAGPLGVGFESLPRLVHEINHSDAFRIAITRLAQELSNQSRSAVIKPEFFPEPSLYTVIHIQKMNRVLTSTEIVETLPVEIAKALRASDEPIGSKEVARAIAPNVTYSEEDIVFVSSKAAVVFDDSAEILDVFELANTQSIELRFIDARLDRTLQRLYETNETTERNILPFLDSSHKQTQTLNSIHLDSTIIAERVQQGFKFTQDSYELRIHELTTQQIFLPAYSASVSRKLAAIRDVASDIRDRAATQRMEFLEWVIVILFAIETLPQLWKSIQNLFH